MMLTLNQVSFSVLETLFIGAIRSSSDLLFLINDLISYEFVSHTNLIILFLEYDKKLIGCQCNVLSDFNAPHDILIFGFFRELNH